MANNCNKTFRDLINDGEVKFLGIASIVPMGAWNATTTYQKLNYVRHNGATYLAKTSSKNVEPGVAQNWQDVWMLCNYDGGVSQVVSDGTYPNMTVGNATNAENANTATNAQQAQQAQKIVGSYEQLEDGTYNLVIGVTGDAPSAAAITQINGEDLAGKEFYEYVRTKGAVLFSFNPDFSPAARYGGSWENITDRFLVGAGGSYTLGSTGGSAMHTHDLDGLAQILNTDTNTFVYTFKQSTAPWISTAYFLVSGTGGQSVQPSAGVKVTGNTNAAANEPPYIAVNIWRRVA